MIDDTPDLPPSNAPENPSKPDALELVCLGILRTEFGRRPSRAVTNAILRLAAEDAVASVPAARPAPLGIFWRINQWFRQLPPRPAFALGAALIVVIGLAVYFLKAQATVSRGGDALAGCTLTDARDMRWAAGAPQLKVGGKIPAGWLRLDSGVVEVTFATTTKIAVEGPAQFRLTSVNSLELRSGKIATDVPRRAKGFTLETPTATVVDLGTRFGAIVGSDQSSEVDVFQGRIRLASKNGEPNSLTTGMAMFVDDHGATPASALPETAFPQPNLAVEVRPQNCGFDVSGRAATGEVPVAFGYWSGLSYSLTGAVSEITPASGPGMLEFFNSSASRSGPSDVWQLIDLRPYRKLLAGGQVEASLTALFNRVAGDAGAAKTFGLAFAAFHGSPADARELWASRQTQAIALAEKELVADNQPDTWEPLEAAAKLPPQTDFIIVQIRALAPAGSPGVALAGHYADLVDLRLCTPMRKSSIALK